MVETDGAEQNEEVNAGLEERAGADAEKTPVGDAEEQSAGVTEAPIQESAGEGLYEKLFGAGGKSEKGEKDEKDSKDLKDNKGAGEEKPGKTEEKPGKPPLTEKWVEGYAFQVGRDRLVVGQNISVSAANEIRRGRIALAEAAKTKQELERMKRDRTNQSNQTDRTGFHDTPLPRKAGEGLPQAPAAPAPSPAAPSVEIAAKRDELVRALKEELGEETARKLTDFLDLSAQSATAELTRKNAELQAKLEGLEPTLQRHQEALSEVEQRQARAKNLETFEVYLDKNPQLREYGADAERMLDFVDEAFQAYLNAGSTWEQMDTRQGASACIEAAKSRLMEEYLSGLQGRKTGSETEKRAPKSSSTAPRGSVSPGSGGARNPRDANAQALALVNGR
jgi:hypothetical protein